MSAFFSSAVERIVGMFERKDEREFLPAALEVVETPASPTGRIVAILIISFFVCAVAWAFIGRVDIMATAQGRILPKGNVKVVQPFDAGVVKAIYVQDGQFVHKGQLLVELDPTTPFADRDRLTESLIQAELDVARLSALESGFKGGRPTFTAPPDAPPERVEEARTAMLAQAAQQAAKIADYTQQIAQKEAELAGVGAETDKTKAGLPMLEEKDRINRDLTARGYGTTLAALDASEALSDARHDLDIAARKGQEAVAAKAALQRQRDGARFQYEADVLSDLRKAEEQQNEARQELIKAQIKSSGTKLLAPTDGIVEQLAIHTLKGVVLPGQHLMTVVPNGQDLMIEAKLANKDVGFIYPGQPVKVKIETFNFTRYGIIDGKVMDVSRDTVEEDPRNGDHDNTPPAADATPVPKSDSPTYVARIALLQTSMMVDGEERTLQPGMSITAEIRTGSRSIADYILSPIARKTQESLHER